MTDHPDRKQIRQNWPYDTLDQMKLLDICRTFRPKSSEHRLFSSAHGTFTMIDHMVGHKARLSKFRRIEIISSIFSNHNAMRLKVNHKKKNCKIHRHVEVKQYTSKQSMDH